MKRVITAIYFIVLLPFFSSAQICDTSFLGSKTLYVSQQLKYTAPPKGYLPVFINDAGRHGSRHLTKAVSTYSIYQAILKADSLNALTPAGRQLKQEILRLNKVEQGHLKSISDRGIMEQLGLADRTDADYANVFNTKKLVLNITYTSEIRTYQTSEAFTNELKLKVNNTDTTITRQINDSMLRFYDSKIAPPTYTKYKDSGAWRKEYFQPLKLSLRYDKMADTIVKYFVTPSFAKTIDGEKFIADLFSFITIFYSIQQEIRDAGYTPAEVDMEKFLSCYQLAILGIVDNAEEFFEKGPGVDVNNGIQVIIAKPLLEDFINTTDSFIKNRSVNAQLRFCHAETIAPYAALLGFTGASESTKNPKSIHKVWKSEKVIPLSSNVKWILYQKRGEENYLVKFLLNEKEVAVKGLTTATFPYYNWESVRSFYKKKIKNIKY